MELPVKSPKAGGWRPQYRIETKSLTYNLPASQQRYGTAGNSTSRVILKNVSCEAPPGKLVAIVGPSGAGKTTLLSILAGMIHPSRVSGEILVNGCQMDVSRFRRVSEYITQDDALFLLLTVEECFTYSTRLRLRTTSSDSAARVRELIRELGLAHGAGWRIGDGISGGERRRVGVHRRRLGAQPRRAGARRAQLYIVACSSMPPFPLPLPRHPSLGPDPARIALPAHHARARIPLPPPHTLARISSPPFRSCARSPLPSGPAPPFPTARSPLPHHSLPLTSGPTPTAPFLVPPSATPALSSLHSSPSVPSFQRWIQKHGRQ